MKSIAICSLAFVAMAAESLWGGAGSAVEKVRSTLARSGIRAGVDSGRGRYVFIGSCEREVGDLALDDKFMSLRNDCAKIAELSARRDLIKARSVTVSAKDSGGVASDGDVTVRHMKSVFKAMAADEESGSFVLTSAESWNGKIYQVAVAVCWSKKAEEKGVLMQAANLPSGDSVEDDEEWRQWAESVNIASVIGSRQFLDSRGKPRYLGVGNADIHGKRGVELKKALRQAQLSAKENLAFAVYSKTVSRDVAVSVLSEIEAGNLREEDAWETFVSRVMRQCKGRIVKGREVYCSDEVICPITGREMYVSVYGIDSKMF